MKKLSLAFGIAALVAGFGSAALAQTVPPVPATPDLTQGIIEEGKDVAAQAMAPKPAKPGKAKKVKVPASITLKITNSSSNAATALTIGLAGSGAGQKVITKPLAPNKSISVKLNTKKGCTFDINGAYEDGTTVAAEGVDFCADNTLVLKD